MLKFLSTPSARRATPKKFRVAALIGDFYPRPPRGGRPCVILKLKHDDDEFLSTPSARRATILAVDPIYGFIISIHALREEGDRTRPSSAMTASYFYPRPPRGGRRAGIPPSMRVSEFLSTPSARRATAIRKANGVK